MSFFLSSILAALFVGILSFVGVIGLVLREKLLHKIVIFLVSFAAGGLIGGAFFHMIPEALEIAVDSTRVFIYLLVGFCLFFLLERVLRWHHCHDDNCDTHRHLGWINLFGDGVHNFIDGMVIFAAFLVSPALGIAVTLSIILHEIPQELGDFGVLIYSGFSRLKALIYNFISALLSLLGVVVAWILFQGNMSIESFILPFAAGGFIYIAASDLIPEIHKERKFLKSLYSFIIFLVALVFMYLIKILFE